VQVPRSDCLVMCPSMVLVLIISKILLPGVPLDIVCILCNFITHPKILHFWHLTVLFAMPTAVALLQWIGVLGCGCPNSSSVMQKIIPSLQFKKRAPSSASAADAMTKQRIAHNVKNAPFRRMGSPSSGNHHMKKRLQARLRASDSDKYDASECTFMTVWLCPLLMWCPSSARSRWNLMPLTL